MAHGEEVMEVLMTEHRRRRHDQILQWFFYLAIVGTLGGFCQFALTWKLYKEVGQIKAARQLDLADRASRLKAWDNFRDQFIAATANRDQEISLIKKRMDYLDSKKRWDDALYIAVRDRAKQGEKK
jgi:hypothetical protein